MKYFVTALTVWLTVLVIAEAAKDYAKDYEKYYEKYGKPGDDKKEDSQDQNTQKDYANDYEKYYEKYRKKDWEKEYGNSDPEDANEFLDETYQSLKTESENLNLDPLNLPDVAFKLRIQSRTSRVVIQIKATNQVLTGLSSVKRVGEGSIQKYYGDPKLGSVFKAKDLEINGEVSIVGGTLNKSCSVFVDIEELTGRVELALKENKSDPLTVATLRIFSPNKPYLELPRDCVDEKEIQEQIVGKYQESLREDLGNSIRKPFKDSLNKVLKPFQGKQ